MRTSRLRPQAGTQPIRQAPVPHVGGTPTGSAANQSLPTNAQGDIDAQTSPTAALMEAKVRISIGLWIITLATVALGNLPWAWALAEQLGRSKPGLHARWLGVTFTPQTASILLIIVVLTAMLGSAATLALTFAHRAGYNRLEKGWGWWYVLRPFTAVGIGVLAYALLQAGFFASSRATNSDLLAAASIGGLAGLFTDQLLQKMRKALGLSAFLKSASDPTEARKTNAVDSAP